MVPSLYRSVRAAGLALLVTSSPLFAQDTVQKIKALYASAAYEDTLSALTSLGPADPKPEVEQFRVFSLVALGRLAEAERVVEAVLKAHPRYRPEPSEASPRIQELFAKVRSRVGPGVVKTLYADAKAALDNKDRDSAIALFGEVVTTADDPDIKDQPAVAEFRLLGSGFLELSRALPARPAIHPAIPLSDAPATPAAPSVGPPASVTGPIAIRQELPPWLPPGPLSNAEFIGVVRVMITAAGTVESAVIVASVHPAYDPILLKAARNWLYEPARRNGAAMPSEKAVTVRLKPRA